MTRRGLCGRNTGFVECSGRVEGSFAVGLRKQVLCLLSAVVVRCVSGIFKATSTGNISASWGLRGV